MRIAFVAPGYPYRGGISHFATRLAKEFSQAHECLFINFRRLYPEFLFPGKTQFDESDRKIEFESDRVIDSIKPTSWRKAGMIIRNWKPDGLVFHWWHPFFGPVYRRICVNAGKRVPKVAICHNVAPHDKGGLWKSAVRFGLRKMDGFVVHAHQEQAEINKLLGNTPTINLFHPIYDIFPGEDIPRSTARKKLGFRDEDRVILYFGLIRPYKGVEVLLDAVDKLGDVEGLKVLIVGEIYSNRQEITSKIAKLPRETVMLVDKYVHNEDVATWFRAADIVALPYISATQSGVVPIAYRCKRPVIVTNVGGLPDVVDAGKTGYLVEPSDPETLAEAVRRHFLELNNPDLTQGIEKKCRELSWERYTTDLTDFIAKLAEDNHVGD